MLKLGELRFDLAACQSLLLRACLRARSCTWAADVPWVSCGSSAFACFEATCPISKYRGKGCRASLTLMNADAHAPSVWHFRRSVRGLLSSEEGVLDNRSLMLHLLLL